jgi:transcriptional regulator with XRE-family HTH domain
MGRLLVQGVSQTVREIRIFRNLSQEELAFKSGLDRTYISGVERGIRNISLESLESIVVGLGIGLPEFLFKLQKNIASLSEDQG